MASTAPVLKTGLRVLRPPRNLKTSFMIGDTNNAQTRLCFGEKRRALVVSSVLDKSRGKKINGYRDPTLEKLFVQTQELEEDTGNKHVSIRLLESDVHAAVEVLRRKEEELKASERALDLERRELRRLQNDVNGREKRISNALALQARLEQELKTSKEEYDALACELDRVRLALQEREREVFDTQHALAAREREVEMLRGELQKKEEQLTRVNLEFRSKDQLLNEANLIIGNQQTEIKQLRVALAEKESDLAVIQKKREEEEQKLKIAESFLEKRWVAYLVAQQTMKDLVHEVSKYQGRTLVAVEDLERVRSGLSSVKEELVFSQKELAASRQRLREQETQIDQQLQELSVQKNALVAYEERLRDANSQVENEREKLRIVEQNKKLLQQELFYERQAVNEFKAELQRNRACLQQAVEETKSLKNEADRRTLDLAEAQTLLGVKGSELMTARVEMQKLESELESVQALLKDKGNDLDSAQKYIEELHEEISDLKALMRSKEDELATATDLLQEKETNMNVMQLDLDDNKIWLSQAASMVEGITELTNTLVGSPTEGRNLNMDEDSLLIQTNYELFASRRALIERQLEIQRFREKSEEDTKKFQEKEAEIESIKALLREKEKELLNACRALAVKDEELKALVSRWEGREKEIMKMRDEVMEEAKGLNSLYASAQNRVGNKTLGELAVEKLQLDAAKLEAEAAMNALRNVVDLSYVFVKENRELLSDPPVDSTVCREGGGGNSLQGISTENLADLNDKLVKKDVAMEKTRKAITDLTAMTKNLIGEGRMINTEIEEGRMINTEKEAKPAVALAS